MINKCCLCLLALIIIGTNNIIAANQAEDNSSIRNPIFFIFNENRNIHLPKEKFLSFNNTIKLSGTTLELNETWSIQPNTYFELKSVNISLNADNNSVGVSIGSFSKIRIIDSAIFLRANSTGIGWLNFSYSSVELVNSTFYQLGERSGSRVSNKYPGLMICDSNISVESSRFIECNTGIFILNSNLITIKNSEFFRNHAGGVRGRNLSFVKITNSSFQSSGRFGVHLTDVGNSDGFVELSSSHFSDFEEFGIELERCSNVMINGNLIRNSPATGIYLDTIIKIDSNNNTISYTPSITHSAPKLPPNHQYYGNITIINNSFIDLSNGIQTKGYLRKIMGYVFWFHTAQNQEEIRYPNLHELHIISNNFTNIQNIALYLTGKDISVEQNFILNTSTGIKVGEDFIIFQTWGEIDTFVIRNNNIHKIKEYGILYQLNLQGGNYFEITGNNISEIINFYGAGISLFGRLGGLSTSKRAIIARNIINNSNGYGLQGRTTQSYTVDNGIQFVDIIQNAFIKCAEGYTKWVSKSNEAGDVYVAIQVRFDDGIFGNYWENFNGTDTDFNKISETHYYVFPSASWDFVDKAPLLSLLLISKETHGSTHPTDLDLLQSEFPVTIKWGVRITNDIEPIIHLDGISIDIVRENSSLEVIFSNLKTGTHNVTLIFIIKSTNKIIYWDMVEINVKSSSLIFLFLIGSVIAVLFAVTCSFLVLKRKS